MSDNVVGLDGKSVTPPEEDTLEPIPELVSLLEKALSQAKEGKLRNIVYLAAYGESEFAQAMVGNFEDSNPFIASTLLEVQRNNYLDTYIYGFSLEEEDEQ